MSRSLFMALSLVLLAAGLLVMLGSINWGSQAANAYLRSQGGGMDTSQFMIVFQEYINLYRWMGSILAIVGGLGFVRTIELR
jgi:glucose-6-phosphate-specific signal transduction histidine kinase